MPAYTRLQGQYLAFIYNYTKINGLAPAEADMQRYFRTSPPTVHTMILTLEKHGFICRKPGRARSIQVVLLPEQLPYLE
jgi:repressor LexA